METFYSRNTAVNPICVEQLIKFSLEVKLRMLASGLFQLSCVLLLRFGGIGSEEDLTEGASAQALG